MDNLKLKPFGAILMLVGVILLGLAAHDHSKEGPLWEEPKVVEGRVIERFTTSRGRASKPQLRLRIQVPAAGSVQVIERKVDDEFWNEHGEGTRVELAYNGLDVDEARVIGGMGMQVGFWLKVVGGTVGMLLGLVVLGYDRWRT